MTYPRKISVTVRGRQRGFFQPAQVTIEAELGKNEWVDIAAPSLVREAEKALRRLTLDDETIIVGDSIKPEETERIG
jgi:hypothetical protein